MELPERPDGILTLEDEETINEMEMRVRVTLVVIFLVVVVAIIIAIMILSNVEGIAKWKL